MKKLVTLIALLIVIVSCKAQKVDFKTDSRKAKKLLEEAISYYNLRYFDQAFAKVDEALAEDSLFVDAYMLKGEMYMELSAPDSAIVFLKKAIQITPNEFPSNYYNIGKASLSLNQLEETKNYLNKFLEFPDNRQESISQVEDMLAAVEVRKKLMANPKPFDPINLGGGVNSGFYEHSPTITTDEQTLYFTRKERKIHPGGFEMEDEDFYISYLQIDGNWSQANNLGKRVNSEFNEGASCISADGRYLFFTSCDKPGSFGSCDLFLARKQGDSWVNPINLGSPINSHWWESQPSFSADGRTLYFASNRKGGKGKTDIYVTRIGDNGQWSEPKLVPINTKGNDQSPFIHPNGKRFYFSSDGLPGMGLSDLYYVDIDAQGNWGEPVNLGYPINTGGSEVSLIVTASGKTAYYSSDMDGGFGRWDLYKFELPEEDRAEAVVYAKGKVYDSETKQPLSAHFEILSVETGEKLIEATSDPVTGEFIVVVPTEDEYAFNASSKGYLFFSENFNFKGEKAEARFFDIPLDQIKAGKSVVLKNVFFETSKFELKSTSKVELNKLVSFLSQNTSVSIEIGGHTDNVGSNESNQQLSENRAKSVYDYLVNHGVSAERLTYKGYSSSMPIASNDTEAGRAKNRRTEFKVLSTNH